MHEDPPRDKYLAVCYIDREIITTKHDQWEEALKAAESPYLKVARRWCHGNRDRGHWTLVQVIGSVDVPHEVVNGKWSNGILRPGPLAIIFVPETEPCCEHHLAAAEYKKLRSEGGIHTPKPQP